MKNIVLPDLGEGIEKGTVSLSYVKEGDIVKEGDDIVELVTDKAAFNVPTEYAGRIQSLKVKQGQEVKIGDVLAVLE
ncbi:MAG: biotin/lipoyl-binding protein [Candidatus Omnitrophica bacterium]|nr:biotin/lipoyl-binding protein [Candidatus Omnitrophota bacterium]